MTTGKSKTVQEVIRKRQSIIPFDGAWKDAFGQTSKTGIWIVYGKTGNGKSNFSMQLARCLAGMGMKIAYFSWEEGCSLSFQNAMRIAGWLDVCRRILVEEPVPTFDDFLAFVKHHRSVSVYIFDTVQRWSDLKKRPPPASRSWSKHTLTSYLFSFPT